MIGGCSLHAVGGVSADEVLGVDFSGDDADVGVPAGTLVTVRALTQSVGVHFLHFGALLDAEQPARLLPLTPQPLQHFNVNNLVLTISSDLSVHLTFLEESRNVGLKSKFK